MDLDTSRAKNDNPFAGIRVRQCFMIANTVCSQLFILHPKEKALIHGTNLEIGKIVAILGNSRL